MVKFSYLVGISLRYCMNYIVLVFEQHLLTTDHFYTLDNGALKKTLNLRTETWLSTGTLAQC